MCCLSTCLHASFLAKLGNVEHNRFVILLVQQQLGLLPGNMCYLMVTVSIISIDHQLQLGDKRPNKMSNWVKVSIRQ